MAESNKNQSKKTSVSRREFLIAGGAVISTIALSACTPKTSTVTSTTQVPTTITNTTTATTKVAVTVWDIPLLTTMTGAMAYIGAEMEWMLNYAASEINAAGGIEGVPIKFTSYDDGNSPTQALSVAANIIPDSLLMIGPFATVNAIAPLLISNHILSIGGWNGPSARASAAPYCCGYQVDAPTSITTGIEAWLPLVTPSIKKLCFICQTPDSWNSYVLVPAAVTKDMGVSCLVIQVPTTTLDLTATVAQADAAGCQAYATNISPTQHINLAQALFNRGITQGTEIWGSYGTDNPALFTVGKGYLENSYINLPENTISTKPGYVKLASDYIAKYGGAPGTSLMDYYDVVYAIKNAFETLGITGDPSKLSTERGEIAAYLYNSPKFQGILRQFQWVNGQMFAPFTIMQIKNNAYTFVCDVPATGIPPTTTTSP